MRSKDRVDPELARLVEERLERLLAERGPRRADAGLAERREPDPTTDPPTLGGAPRRLAGAVARSTLDAVDTTRRWPAFTRAHLAIIGVIVTLGVLLAGWAVLRARPVPLPAAAIAAPRATPSAPSTGARPTTAPAPPGSATSARASPGTLVVHVLGAVKRPGLVQLREPARVQDAIHRAGGLRSGADLGDLNLAQVLSDGQQLMIGQSSDSGKERGSELRGAGSPGSPGTAGSSNPSAQVDLNTATTAELETLPGVGPVTAAKIIAWREEHGRFGRVEELQEVAGIGPKTYAELAPHCRV